MKQFMRSALAIALVVASGTAAALGLGQIEVKSKIGQPLLAEIPIISNDPAELEQLRAGLASPDTFARIGLQPPQGIVADLAFVSALDAAGRPVIRVTSQQPVSDPLLTFLVEVDWGQGRLVREYSALMDAPRTVSAPVQPLIAAPVIEAPNVIERPITEQPLPAPAVATRPQASSAPERVAPAASTVQSSNAITATPSPAAQPDVLVATAPDARGTRLHQYGPVKAGDSLSRIAGQVGEGFTVEQAMIAMLRANPDAFIGGNINRLKQGAVLRIPAPSELSSAEMQQATSLVQGQMQQWRQARTAPQPITADAAVAPAQPQPRAATRVASAATTTGNGARLEIVPPGASRATKAGTQSGISAGGEGKMLRQELQQTRESLAARDSELKELQGRIAELEKIQGDQQQLLTLKDSELAAAQQRLAKAQSVPAAKPPASPAASATVAASTASPSVTGAPSSNLPWVLGGVGVLVLALLGGWLLRRRATATPKFRAPAGPSIADAFAPMAPAPVAVAIDAPVITVADPAPVPTAERMATAPVVAPAAAVEDAVTDVEPLPFWDRRERPPQPSGRPAASASPQAPTSAPAWHGGATAKSQSSVVPATDPVAAAIDADPAVVPGQERLELARAYLDLGDRDSARQLLGEVALSGDHDARQQASRMLRELE